MIDIVEVLSQASYWRRGHGTAHVAHAAHVEAVAVRCQLHDEAVHDALEEEARGRELELAGKLTQKGTPAPLPTLAVAMGASS